MNEETKLWKKLKKNTPKILWTRLESWASFGVPDLLGYHDSCGFFMVELKIARIEEPLARSIKLYQSSTVNGLLSDHRETPCVAFDDWDHIQRLLLDAPLA
jgi:hypothetical protein